MTVRTEKEKMLAGESYNLFDPALEVDRQAAKKFVRQYNRAESTPEREAILHQMLGCIGPHSIIEPPFYCTYGKNTYLGDYVYLNHSCTIIDNNDVRIGDHVMVGPCVQIYTAAHPLQAEPRIQGWEIARSIIIEDNVWVGGAAVLLPGVKIGRNAVVGAGAVVTRDVQPNTVVVGNPARVIKEIRQE